MTALQTSPIDPHHIIRLLSPLLRDVGKSCANFQLLRAIDLPLRHTHDSVPLRPSHQYAQEDLTPFLSISGPRRFSARRRNCEQSFQRQSGWSAFYPVGYCGNLLIAISSNDRLFNRQQCRYVGLDWHLRREIRHDRNWLAYPACKGMGRSWILMCDRCSHHRLGS